MMDAMAPNALSLCQYSSQNAIKHVLMIYQHVCYTEMQIVDFVQYTVC